MKWNDEVMGGEAFENWRPFDHPQLGPVEIGGWKGKLYEQNAPLKYLPDMCKKHSRFTLSHASLNPYLSLRTLDVNRQGENVYRVVAVIENNGFLPTYTSQKALERQDVRPIEAELQLPEGVSLMAGERRQDMGQLQGRSNKIWSWWSGASPTDNRRKVEWVFKATPGSRVELTVRAQRAGVVRQVIALD
jgi:murein tripeptide amidase MpaA